MCIWRAVISVRAGQTLATSSDLDAQAHPPWMTVCVQHIILGHSGCIKLPDITHESDILLRGIHKAACIKLHYTKTHACWDPENFMENHTACCMRLPFKHLTCHVDQGKHFLWCICTGNETLVTHIIPKTKKLSIIFLSKLIQSNVIGKEDNGNCFETTKIRCSCVSQIVVLCLSAVRYGGTLDTLQQTIQHRRPWSLHQGILLPVGYCQTGLGPVTTPCRGLWTILPRVLI